jgi:hypothetical protein
MKLLSIYILGIILAFSCRKESHSINLDELKGRWYLNQWTTYHTLIFSDTAIFVDNNIDTVFTLGYSLSRDTLITWSEQINEQFKNKIIFLTRDSLVLDGIADNRGTRNYSRVKRAYSNH